MGSSTEGPNGTTRMRQSHPGQRFVAPYGSLPKAQVGPPACVNATQDNVSWLHKKRAPPKPPVDPGQRFVAP
eukprot:399785-Pyramimonas_sp.AAC.1